MSNDIFAGCMAISMSHFLNTPYKEQTITEMYAPDGFANKALGICHYCTVATLKEILNNECLRFSDVRFLNDSIEFIEIIPLIENVPLCNDYTSDLRKLILESAKMEELKEYLQSYTVSSRITHKYEQKIYRTYTCSFRQRRIRLACGIIMHHLEKVFVREENSMFELGIKELLWQNKMEDVDIFSSGILIRKYS